jgi:hypothetical protein
MAVKETWVSLTGGLGNQLFQFAAANSIDSDRIILLSRFGMPRMTDGTPDILFYKMPPKVMYKAESSDPIFFRKVVGYLLRSGIFPKRFEQNLIVRGFVNLSARLLIGLRLGKWLTFCVGRDVGFSEIYPKSKKVMLVGYFQTHRFMDLPDVARTMNELELQAKPLILLEHEKHALEEIPLVVHVRLGDYRLEQDFGTLAESYYRSVEKLWGSGRYKKIWLFSDEPEAAISFIPKLLQGQTRVIRDEKESPATTLELMRLGTGYVIANSSLSWWGAMLSRNQNPEIVAPNPWFRAMPEPKELIPKNWNRQEGFKTSAEGF